MARRLTGFVVLVLGLSALLPAARVVGQDDTEKEIQRLAELLTDPTPLVRKRAAISLGEFGPVAVSAYPALKKALAGEKDEVVKKEMDKALKRIGTPLKDLVALVLDDRGDLAGRKDAVKALAERHWKEEGTVKALDAALLDPALRADAARALEEVDRRRRGGVVFKGHDDLCYGVAYTPDGKRVLSSGHDGFVRLWDAASGKERRAFKAGEPLFQLALSKDGKRVAAGGLQTAFLWDLEGGGEPLLFKGHEGETVNCVALHPDGKRLASAGDDKDIILYEIGTGKELKRLMGHENVVYTLAFNPAGTLLASASEDGHVRVWDVKSGDCVNTYAAHGGAVYGVAFSPDGKRVASGGAEDMTVRLWDAPGGDNELKLEGHTAGVRGVAFSPDGKLLASASDDKTVRLWDAKTGKPVAVLEGHSREVIRVAFSPDGKSLASTSWDHDVRIWKVPGVAP